jgi:hypothetical protein
MSERRFNIGDVVYNARCQWVSKQVLCPVCFGKCQVTLILGNDDSVVLPCDYCGKGFDNPTGYVGEYDYVVEAELVTITDIKVEISSDGEKYQYISSYYHYDTENLFIDKEEALARAKELKKLLDEEQQTRVAWIKHDRLKSFSWNAGYHLREAKRNRKDAEYHDQKAILCKQRAKKDKK